MSSSNIVASNQFVPIGVIEKIDPPADLLSPSTSLRSREASRELSLERTNRMVELQSSWQFWHDTYTRNSNTQFESSVHTIGTPFKTVQEFWCVFNNMPITPMLMGSTLSSFHLMKTGVRPLWEDPNNANGGMWTVRISKDDSEYSWEQLVLAVIGEQFQDVLDPRDDIQGVTVSVRQNDNILIIWNKNASCEVQRLLQHLQFLLPDVTFRSSFYKAHRDHNNFNK
eukprot:gnl/Spiro4/15445_TR8313_c0_g1_i1.p1 gnl/Spiro4/15445_TR8313_c0_g1~~gnl/Spiro4/15445_TR8313_c0_g1_i1.p1  ORF type:complete len:226 (-),score=33.21 gnl/Spiro4/15445_TR8313_c0_g1_i1:100-777(-)